MAPKNTISQLDLVLLGRRGLTARLGNVEGQVKRLVTGTGGETAETATQELRPNLFTNSSFEFYDRGSTKPQDWTVTGTATVSVGSAGADGTNTLLLPAGASVTQAAAAGVTVPHASVVISVAAKTAYASQKIAIGLTHAPGYQAGPIMRLDITGGLIQTDDVPADGNWYRFYRQFILTGGNTASAVLAQAGSGTLEIDAAKFEKEDGVAAWLEPTAYVSADWGAATHIRNLAAENIVTGTLVVGGSISTNPRISVKDGSDVEIVTIGAPTGGFYGVEIKGAAGLRVSGTGSAEVLGGGSVKVKGGGDITVDGGNIAITNGGLSVSGTGGISVSGGGSVTIGNTGSLLITGTGGIAVSGGGNITVGNTGSVLVTGTGVIRAGTAGAQRVDMLASGLSLFNASNVETVRADAADGKLKVLGDGGLTVSGSGGILVSGGGGITVDNSGLIILTGTGIVRAGPSTGYHAELGAGGLALFGSTGSQTILMSSITGKVHVFDDSLQIENGGKLTYVSGLVWADNQGFWMIDASGNAAFGISGVDAKVWGNIGQNLDKGDVLIGHDSQYVLWDASAGALKISGQLVVGTTNKLWLNDTNDGSLAIGGTVKASAPFRVSAAGALTATNATLTGSLTATSAKITNAGLAIDTGLDANFNPLYAVNWQTFSTGQIIGSAYGYVGFQQNGLVIEAKNTAGRRGLLTLLASTSGYTDSYITLDASALQRIIINAGTTIVDHGTFQVNNGGTIVSTGSIKALGNSYTYGNLYIGTDGFGNPQTTRYFRDDGTYTRFNGNLVVDGDLYANGRWFSQYINQAVLTTSAVNFASVTGGTINMTAGGSAFGNVLTDYLPTSTNWGSTTNLIVQGNDFSSIGFHDAGSRVDFIVGGGGILRLGYNGGWGPATITVPGNLRVSASGIYVGNTGVAPSYLIHLATDSAGKPNGGSWTNSSDLRLKNLEGDYTRGLDDLRRLRPILFSWNGKLHQDDGVHAGFIAQEVQKVAPEMVSTIKGELDGEETDILQLNLSDLPLMLRNAVVQLADEVADLRAEVATLKGSA